jgi:hypothetical protein
MTLRLLRAKISFFDTNPLGSILTRFSKDLTVCDMILSYYYMHAFIGIFRCIAVFTSLSIV